jgi:hypothetical protein
MVGVERGIREVSLLFISILLQGSIILLLKKKGTEAIIVKVISRNILYAYRFRYGSPNTRNKQQRVNNVEYLAKE